MANLELFKPPQEMRELNILQELEMNPIISQRELSHKFGIALGVTNACLKRMTRRGWIRIMGLNHRRVRYYLTPQGFAEKAKLSLHLISWTVQHYAALKDIIGNRLHEMQRDGVERIVFYGVCDEMEIAYVSLQGVNLKLVGIVEDEDKMARNEIFGFELQEIHQVERMNPDGVLITTLMDTKGREERLRRVITGEQLKIYDISVT